MNAQLTRVAAAAAATALTGVATFQVALALGVPWGAAAWGGGHARLTPGLRAGSAITALFLAGAAVLVLARARASRYTPRTNRRLGAATWALTALLALSAAGNLASASVWERRLQGPLALLIAVLCLVVARTGRRDQRPRIR